MRFGGDRAKKRVVTHPLFTNRPTHNIMSFAYFDVAFFLNSIIDLWCTKAK